MASGGPSQAVQLQAGLQTELRALPGLLKAMGMLAMTHEEVHQATEHLLAENPVLERADGHPCPGAAGTSRPGPAPAAGDIAPHRGSTTVWSKAWTPSAPCSPLRGWRSGRIAGTPWTWCWRT
ncbi:hypothetical protein [Arthrobacter sp. SD76]|uniref:hypothetical protein n=1 Tax=Arthrobacter sp. SD76 TaxID=3415007 RepID=UPI003C75405B